MASAVEMGGPPRYKCKECDFSFTADDEDGEKQLVEAAMMHEADFGVSAGHDEGAITRGEEDTPVLVSEYGVQEVDG